MNRRAAKKVVLGGLALPARRHCSSDMDLPEEDGFYLVQGFPGDCWRRLHLVDGHFYSGLTRQQWFRWKPCAPTSC